MLFLGQVAWGILLTFVKGSFDILKGHLHINYKELWWNWCCTCPTKFTKKKKVININARILSKHMHNFRLWRKHVQSCKEIGINLYEELCSWGTQFLYIEGEKRLSSQCGKSDKKWSNNYIQTTCISSYHRENTCKASFKATGTKLWEECANKRYPLSIYWGWKMTKFTIWKKWQKMI